MNDRHEVPDLAERRRALDPGGSFIVQAPAGSGKTELLIQRALVLLAVVARPEEICAITFTRKAAAEMRKRVFAALAMARSGERPGEPHEAATWELARAALARNDALGWNLAECASRLRVQTIDSLCASLTRQMPVLAKFGAQPESIEDASEIHLEAARATLSLLEADGALGDDVALVLAHVDNDRAQAETLLAGLLARRDHWLRYLGAADQRAALEGSLADVRREAVERAAALLKGAGKAGPEGMGAQAVQAWIAFAGELLTKKGEWRKGQALARELAGNEEILEALRALLSLPPATYEDGQWKALGALARVARAAVANLKVAFAARGQADFIEIAQGALRALGTDEEPTDLLLALDYRIRHILVDEFQDTSVSQYELLARLTSGWEPGDGRTLFAVGDPMQSIYRFREAEVGLFLRARREGIGSVAPERITLSANFRSRRGIVEWVNRAFTRVMPAREDVGSGAVTYSPSRAIHEDGEGGEGVTVHAFFDGDRLGEARRVASLAKAALSESAATDGKPRTVAILVRARSALAQIVPALKAEGLRLCAVEIDPLAERPVVRDLLALTRALLHPADRAAWLGVLRAPWCGLTLADLLALAGREETAAGDSPQDCGDTILEAILDERRLARLSADGAARLARTRAVLCAALANRCRGTLRRAVEGAWLALGGPACVEDGPALEEADAYLDHLEQAEDAGGLADLAAFEEGLEKLFAPPDESADRRLQVMTIHKAKGLEFDTVIVPGLGAGVPPDERRLFLWMERPRTGRDGAQTDLLLAPMHPAGAQKDPIHEYIRGLDRMKGDLENGRLLYVAATRAKRRLHLLGDAKRGDGEDRAALKGPRKGSLLAKLWPAVEEDFARAAREAPGEPGLVPHLPPRGPKGLARLAPSFVLPAAPAPVAWHPPAEEGREEEPVEFSWAGETARLSGIVVHRWLQCIAEEGLKGWDAGRVRSLGPRIRSELLLRGQLASDLEEAAVRVERALVRALDDAKGRWILGPHAWAACEYRVTAVAGGARRRLVMDRVFTDEHGARWIVDYKSGAHEGAGVEAFLDREKERYAPKMRSYEAALGPGARAALYFPLVPGWREIG